MGDDKMADAKCRECTAEQWLYCRVEKRGCYGCHYYRKHKDKEENNNVH